MQALTPIKVTERTYPFTGLLSFVIESVPRLNPEVARLGHLAQEPEIEKLRATLATHKHSRNQSIAVSLSFGSSLHNVWRESFTVVLRPCGFRLAHRIFSQICGDGSYCIDRTDYRWLTDADLKRFHLTAELARTKLQTYIEKYAAVAAPSLFP